MNPPKSKIDVTSLAPRLPDARVPWKAPHQSTRVHASHAPLCRIFRTVAFYCAALPPFGTAQLLAFFLPGVNFSPHCVREGVLQGSMENATLSGEVRDEDGRILRERGGLKPTDLLAGKILRSCIYRWTARDMQACITRWATPPEK